MVGKGRAQGGMSGGARVGTGPKKRPGAPPTRKEKRAAKASKAAAAREAPKSSWVGESCRLLLEDLP